MPDDPTAPFNPDWCLAPAATLREWMSDNGLDVPSLSALDPDPGMAAVEIGQVLSREPLTCAHADTLAICTGISAGFWLNYERNYRDGLAAGLTDVTPEDADA